MNYQQLEPRLTSSLGITVPSFTGSTSLYQTSVYIYTLFFIAIIGASFYRYVLAGIWRMEASEQGLRKSNETIKKTTLGLLGVFGLFLILFTVNKGMLTGDVNLDGLRSGGGQSPSTTNIGQGTAGAQLGTVEKGSISGSSKACEAPATIISNVQSGNVCAGTSCSSLSGCSYGQYLPIIQEEASRAGVNYRTVVALICKESGGKATANNRNPNGTYDCGLMQVNQNGICSTAVNEASIRTNIATGVSLLRQKMAGATQVYPGIPSEGGAFASYNCCANGTIPNTPSDDCKAGSNGFTQTIPKWACPINPGDGQFNMCGVKAYTCEIIACASQVP
jgi:Transglycosylase SLT domain